ncbi:MAG: alkane 1-monooxygenase [Pseudomonadota bacterium]
MSRTFTPTGLLQALPFWASLALPLLLVWAAVQGGWALLLVPLVTWHLATLLDRFLGLNVGGADPETPEQSLFWYNLILWLWPAIQLATVFGMLAYVTATDHLSTWGQIGVFLGVGVITGTIGLNYAHELMHRSTRWERWLADILLASVFYSHFRTEHLLVHHRHVGTPRDAVTARYNEHFHAYFARVLPQALRSALRAEAGMCARKGVSPWHRSNPFWRYAALQALVLIAAFAVGGWVGVGLVLFQALVAIWQLELVNYVEHYGLTRKHLGDGRYEAVRPCHSWNANHRATNWLLINLQRHSDHHTKPGRPFPLLQPQAPGAAPELPYGYPVMTLAALIPPIWRRIMNPRVRAWRKEHYPEITDWRPYSRHATPLPDGV